MPNKAAKMRKQERRKKNDLLNKFGRTKKHSIRDAANTTTTVKGRSLIRLPNLPPIKINALKARIVVTVAVKTGILILRAPFSAAS